MVSKKQKNDRKSPVGSILLAVFTLTLVAVAAYRVQQAMETLKPVAPLETKGALRASWMPGLPVGPEDAPPAATPLPAATGTPAPADTQEREELEKLVSKLSLSEKIYQMFLVSPEAITGVSKVTASGETTRKALQKYPVGGLCYAKANLVSQEQARSMLENVQEYANIPLLLACDEEGGRVSRLSNLGTATLDAMYTYRQQGRAKAVENAETIGNLLRSCGFNTDFAPVADVWSNTANTVIGNRAYSDDFQEAADLVAGAVEGFHAGGVACTLKHFPGHGDTAEDSHDGPAYVTKTLDDLRTQELLPFRSGIQAGADLVMMGHLIVSDVSEEPALFSEQLVTRLLREEMGFEGVILTDSLQMDAIADFYESGETAVRAVQAGVDMLLCPEDLEAAAQALLEAVESGALSEARINESVLRILTLKKNYGLL